MSSDSDSESKSTANLHKLFKQYGQQAREAIDALGIETTASFKEYLSADKKYGRMMVLIYRAPNSLSRDEEKELKSLIKDIATDYSWDYSELDSSSISTWQHRIKTDIDRLERVNLQRDKPLLLYPKSTGTSREVESLFAFHNMMRSYEVLTGKLNPNQALVTVGMHAAYQFLSFDDATTALLYNPNRTQTDELSDALRNFPTVLAQVRETYTRQTFDFDYPVIADTIGAVSHMGLFNPQTMAGNLTNRMMADFLGDFEEDIDFHSNDAVNFVAKNILSIFFSNRKRNDDAIDYPFLISRIHLLTKSLRAGLVQGRDLPIEQYRHLIEERRRNAPDSVHSPLEIAQQVDAHHIIQRFSGRSTSGNVEHDHLLLEQLDLKQVAKHYERVNTNLIKLMELYTAEVVVDSGSVPSITINGVAHKALHLGNGKYTGFSLEGQIHAFDFLKDLIQDDIEYQNILDLLRGDINLYDIHNIPNYKEILEILIQHHLDELAQMHEEARIPPPPKYQLASRRLDLAEGDFNRAVRVWTHEREGSIEAFRQWVETQDSRLVLLSDNLSAPKTGGKQSKLRKLDTTGLWSGPRINTTLAFLPPTSSLTHAALTDTQIEIAYDNTQCRVDPTVNGRIPILPSKKLGSKEKAKLTLAVEGERKQLRAMWEHYRAVASNHAKLQQLMGTQVICQPKRGWLGGLSYEVTINGKIEYTISSEEYAFELRQQFQHFTFATTTLSPSERSLWDRMLLGDPTAFTEDNAAVRTFLLHKIIAAHEREMIDIEKAHSIQGESLAGVFQWVTHTEDGFAAAIEKCTERQDGTLKRQEFKGYQKPRPIAWVKGGPIVTKPENVSPKLNSTWRKQSALPPLGQFCREILTSMEKEAKEREILLPTEGRFEYINTDKEINTFKALYCSLQILGEMSYLIQNFGVTDYMLGSANYHDLLRLSSLLQQNLTQLIQVDSDALMLPINSRADLLQLEREFPGIVTIIDAVRKMLLENDPSDFIAIDFDKNGYALQYALDLLLPVKSEIGSFNNQIIRELIVQLATQKPEFNNWLVNRANHSLVQNLIGQVGIGQVLIPLKQIAPDRVEILVDALDRQRRRAAEHVQLGSTSPFEAPSVRVAAANDLEKFKAELIRITPAHKEYIAGMSLVAPKDMEIAIDDYFQGQQDFFNKLSNIGHTFSGRTPTVEAYTDTLMRMGSFAQCLEQAVMLQDEFVLHLQMEGREAEHIRGLLQNYQGIVLQYNLPSPTTINEIKSQLLNTLNALESHGIPWEQVQTPELDTFIELIDRYDRQIKALTAAEDVLDRHLAAKKVSGSPLPHPSEDLREAIGQASRNTQFHDQLEVIYQNFKPDLEKPHHINLENYYDFIKEQGGRLESTLIYDRSEYVSITPGRDALIIETGFRAERLREQLSEGKGNQPLTRTEQEMLLQIIEMKDAYIASHKGKHSFLEEPAREALRNWLKAMKEESKTKSSTTMTEFKTLIADTLANKDADAVDVYYKIKNRSAEKLKESKSRSDKVAAIYETMADHKPNLKATPKASVKNSAPRQSTP